MLSKNLKSSVLYDIHLVYYSTAHGMFSHFDLQQLVQPLVVFFDKEQSTPIPYFLSSTQMTIIHLIPELLRLYHLGLAQPMFPSREAASLPFFPLNGNPHVSS